MGINSKFYKNLAPLGKFYRVDADIRKAWPDAVRNEFAPGTFEYTSDEAGSDVAFVELQENNASMRVSEAWRMWNDDESAERAYG